MGGRDVAPPNHSPSCDVNVIVAYIHLAARE